MLMWCYLWPSKNNGRRVSICSCCKRNNKNPKYPVVTSFGASVCTVLIGWRKRGIKLLPVHPPDYRAQLSIIKTKMIRKTEHVNDISMTRTAWNNRNLLLKRRNVWLCLWVFPHRSPTPGANRGALASLLASCRPSLCAVTGSYHEQLIGLA